MCLLNFMGVVKARGEIALRPKTPRNELDEILIENIPYHANNCLVSLDTAIAIGFGIFSALVSLVGVIISYLTLRAMNTDQR
jgi:hypothetical protein